MLMLSQPLPIPDHRGCGVLGATCASGAAFLAPVFICAFSTDGIVHRTGMGI